MKPLSPQKEKELYRLLTKYRKLLLSYTGVIRVMIGYGFEDGALSSEPSLVVHVSKKFDPSLLGKDQLLPRELEGVKVDVIQVNVKKYAVDPRSKVALLTGGISISNPVVNIEGTLGAIFRIRGTSQLVGISNHHVLVGTKGPFRNAGQPGDPIVQPGLQPSGPSFTIGRLAGSNRQLDYALFTIDSADLATDDINGLGGRMTAIGKAFVGQELVKSGVSTGITYGVVVQSDKQSVAIMANQAKQASHIIADAGDSGAVWVTDDNKAAAVALLHGGDHDHQGRQFVLATSMQKIASKAKIEIR